VYGSPYRTLDALRGAARARDATRLSQYVDIPAVRESVKAGIDAKIGAAITKDVDRNPLTVAFGAARASALAIDRCALPRRTSRRRVIRERLVFPHRLAHIPADNSLQGER